MDNEDKIVQENKTTSIFLDNLGLQAISEKDEYILQDEFKGSLKNRNWNVFFILMGMVLFLTLASLGITKWIQARSIITDYKLDEFQDVDLMGVLNQVNNIEKKLDEAERELGILRRDYKKASQDIIDEIQQNILILESRGLEVSELEKRKLTLLNQKDEDLSSIDTKYIGKIAVQEEAVAILREQMSAYDAEKIQQALEYESILANEKKKFKLEKQQIIDSYEQQLAFKETEYSTKIKKLTDFQSELENTLRNTSNMLQDKQHSLFNPIIPEEEESLSRILNKSISDERLTYNLVEPDSTWKDRGYLKHEDFQFFENSVIEWRILMDFMKDIPFRNDVPMVLNQMEYRYLNSLDLLSKEHVNLFEKLFENEKKLEDLIELNARNDKYMAFYNRLSYSLSLKLKDLGGHGIILDSRDKGDFLAYLDPLLDIPSGTLGYVFNLDNEYIGDISIIREELFYNVEILHIEEGRQLVAFDRIFLKMNSSTDERS